MANSNKAQHGSLPILSSLDSLSDEDEDHPAQEDEHQQGQCELGVILVFPDNLIETDIEDPLRVKNSLPWIGTIQLSHQHNTQVELHY